MGYDNWTPLRHTDQKSNKFQRAQNRVNEDYSFEEITCTEHLFDTLDWLSNEKGESPGPDGITYNDLSTPARWWVVRNLSRVMKSGDYCPGPTRPVPIPKSSGQGIRTLQIYNIVDRVAMAALNDALSPMWERLFLPRSYGWRAGRCRLNLLADLEATIAETGANILAIDDVRDAFDHVDLDQLLSEHREVVQDERTLDLATNILRGSERPRRREGIAQGGGYSPTAMNAYLHHAHDLPLDQRVSHLHWFRFADNLAYLCRTKREATRTLDRIGELLLRGGMTLKRDQEPIDLNATKTQGQKLLGFRISFANGRLKLGVDEQEWCDLSDNLVEAHESANAEELAQAVVLGWTDAFAPAFEDGPEPHLRRIMQKLNAAFLGDSVTMALLEGRCSTAIDRWNSIREQAYERRRRESSRGDAAVQS